MLRKKSPRTVKIRQEWRIGDELFTGQDFTRGAVELDWAVPNNAYNTGPEEREVCLLCSGSTVSAKMLLSNAFLYCLHTTSSENSYIQIGCFHEIQRVQAPELHICRKNYNNCVLECHNKIRMTKNVNSIIHIKHSLMIF